MVREHGLHCIDLLVFVEVRFIVRNGPGHAGYWVHYKHLLGQTCKLYAVKILFVFTNLFFLCLIYLLLNGGYRIFYYAVDF